MNQISGNTDDLEIKELINKLGEINGHIRITARKKLVQKGKVVIPYLDELLENTEHQNRWEAMKTLEEIADPESIPVFINALEDSELDIRWMAAEGLIKLGEQSIKPLLVKITEETGVSIFLFNGAHHVIKNLKKKNAFPSGFEIDKFLSALKHHKSTGDVQAYANKLLGMLES